MTEIVAGEHSSVGGCVKMKEVDCLLITVVTDNYYDAVRPDPPIGKRFRVEPDSYIHAEHGLSYFIEATASGKSNAFMFDYGLDPEGVTNNMGVLNIDLSKAGALALSHGHFDHWGGLIGILGNNREKISKGTPLYVGEETFAHRFSLRPGSNDPHDLGALNRKNIEGFETVNIIEIKYPTEVIPGCYLTGNIERVTDYEKVPPSLMIERKGRLEQDLFDGEQAVMFNLKDKGLVVLSGCAHAGIVNTVKHARKISGIEKVYAIMGGFHLINADSEVIHKTVADIKALSPDYIVPTHCTGFEAITTFLKEMPDAFILNTAGTKYVLKA